MNPARRDHVSSYFKAQQRGEATVCFQLEQDLSRLARIGSTIVARDLNDWVGCEESGYLNPVRDRSGSPACCVPIGLRDEAFSRQIDPFTWVSRNTSLVYRGPPEGFKRPTARSR